MSEVKNDELIPSAKRLIKSLRDMGYDFSTAVADLIDNSIDAGATEIHVDVQFEGDDSWVSVADNGRGMTTAEIREALRFGSETEYDVKNLGKFGLGLKTASLSQCQVLSVASRSDPKESKISAFCWDLDHIERVNRWEILPIKMDEMHRMLRDPLVKSTGTVVMWQKLDRILGYKHPYGEFARKRMAAMCRELEDHLAMVFHRFLMGETQRKKISIYLNGNSVRPWDPFARSESKTQCLQSTEIPCEFEEISGIVHIEPFILPPKDEFSGRDAWEHASGPKKWNQQQGLYIYRGDRLIQSGGWSRLRTVDEHTKLARIAISFNPELDDAFKINVAKMRVQLPVQIQDPIQRVIEPVVRRARDRYDRPSVPRPIPNPPPNPPVVTTGNTPITSTSSTHVTNHENPTVQAKPFVQEHTPGYPDTSQVGLVNTEKMWTLEEIQTKLEAAAEPDERQIISRVFTKLRRLLSG
jgi:hypothetical protein